MTTFEHGKRQPLVLCIDAGGTKTLAMIASIASSSKRQTWQAQAGCGNWYVLLRLSPRSFTIQLLLTSSLPAPR